MYIIQLQKNSKNKHNEFDKVIEIDDKDKAFHAYWGVMKEEWFFGRLSVIENNKENNIASFCKSEFA